MRVFLKSKKLLTAESNVFLRVKLAGLVVFPADAFQPGALTHGIVADQVDHVRLQMIAFRLWIDAHIVEVNPGRSSFLGGGGKQTITFQSELLAFPNARMQHVIAWTDHRALCKVKFAFSKTLAPLGPIAHVLIGGVTPSDWVIFKSSFSCICEIS